MTKQVIRKKILRIFAWLAYGLALFIGTQVRGPYLVEVRTISIWLNIIFGSGLIFLGAFRDHLGDKGSRIAIPVIAGGLLILLPLCMEQRQHSQKYVVLSTSPSTLEPYSRHFVLGYRSLSNIRKILKRMPLGGIYLTSRNVRGKNINEVREEIASLQSLQRAWGEPPLLVMADQEGGVVSRMSPPLPMRPNLGQVLQNSQDGPWQEAVVNYANQIAMDLSGMGINCNLSPVVDLKLEKVEHGIDLHTNLFKRATSDDPRLTANAAMLYSITMKGHGVLAVGKHFPGLGHVSQDTHYFRGHLHLAYEKLLENDWLPFAALAHSKSAAILVGHVVLDSVDASELASRSKKVIKGLLRARLGHKGLVLTDDLCMAPSFNAVGGIGASAQKALAASVDLVLVTYDPEMFWPAMFYLLQHRKQIPDAILEKSTERLYKEKKQLGLF